jgi:p-aminobenzoyl-glutamate transporter AbgT
LYLKLSGVFTLAFLTILPTLVLRALHRIKNLDILKKSYRENLIRYTKEKKRLLKLQQIAIVVSFISLLFSPALALKLLRDKTLILSELKPEQLIAIVVVVLLMVFVSRWGYGGYKKVTNSAEALLKDLEG